jgi:hypothetical protein
LAYDHSQIANFTYTWNTPKFVHGNRILEGALDGWQISGYTTYQAGAPLQANGTLQFGFANGLSVPLAGITNAADQLPDNSIPLPNGLRSNAVNQSTWYGTSQGGGGYAGMLPLISCNPQKHASGQYFNPNCFTTPALGQLGTFNWPYIKAPAYFDSDLGIYKNFHITESKYVQFRVQATNFLNHPLPQFGLAGTADETINLQQNSTVQVPLASTTGGNGNGNGCQWIGGTTNAQNAALCDVSVHSISPTNTSNSMTGKPGFKVGQRVLTFAAKFYF